ANELQAVLGLPDAIHARIIVIAAETYFSRSCSTSCNKSGRLKVIAVGTSSAGSNRMVIQRRAISCIGPTLLPLDRISVRVFTTAIFDTPNMRPLINSEVNAVHK